MGLKDLVTNLQQILEKYGDLDVSFFCAPEGKLEVEQVDTKCHVMEMTSGSVVAVLMATDMVPMQEIMQDIHPAYKLKRIIE